MKRAKKKLRVSKSTVRELNPKALGNVSGGVSKRVSDTVVCNKTTTGR